MRRLLSMFVLLGMIVFPSPLGASDSSVTDKAVEAAEAWLAMVDAGNAQGSWDQASALFKTSLPAKDWKEAMAAIRVPFGPVLGRKSSSAVFTTSVPGAPDGEYVVIQFDTAFANKLGAVETVTPQKEKDGTWRVSGYYIR